MVKFDVRVVFLNPFRHPETLQFFSPPRIGESLIYKDKEYIVKTVLHDLDKGSYEIAVHFVKDYSDI